MRGQCGLVPCREIGCLPAVNQTGRGDISFVGLGHITVICITSGYHSNISGLTAVNRTTPACWPNRFRAARPTPKRRVQKGWYHTTEWPLSRCAEAKQCAQHETPSHAQNTESATHAHDEPWARQTARRHVRTCARPTRPAAPSRGRTRRAAASQISAPLCSTAHRPRSGQRARRLPATPRACATTSRRRRPCDHGAKPLLAIARRPARHTEPFFFE